MLISPLLSLSLPLGQGTSEVGGCESVMTTWPCQNYLLSIQSWIQHSCWAGFINFFLILGFLSSVSVAQKFGMSVPPITRTSFCLSFGNFPLGMSSSKLEQVIFLSNTWRSSPFHSKTKPKKKLSQLFSFPVHSWSLWWTSFPKWNEVKWQFVQWWHLHNPDFVPWLFYHLYD